MPKGIYHIDCNTKTPHPPFKPTDHQRATLEAFIKSKYKGMLLYHKLGSGKTCTSILIADNLLRRDMITKVYILSPGSLRENWISQYCFVCGEHQEHLKQYYVFLTYNYAIGKDLPSFDNSLVIIDEVHNLINGVKNISYNPSKIYNALLDSTCRILALSGTPVFNYVYEFALLGRLLKPGNDFPNIITQKILDPNAFMKFFTVSTDGSLTPKNHTSMKRKLEGIVSYYPGSDKHMPRIIEMEPIKCQMTPSQEKNYWEKLEIEKYYSRPPDIRLKATNLKKYDFLRQMYIMSKKNILSRMASNFFYPGELIEPIDLTEGKLYNLYSTKFTAVILNIIMHNRQKHVLFTYFKNKGVYLLKSLLSRCGIRSLEFTGDLNDTHRRVILQKFNSPENRYGDVVRILLVTEAGAEGISILQARHMHILESSPCMNKVIQSIGRVARYKSHSKLPPEERVIKIWRYWSTATPEPIAININVYNRVTGDVETIDKIINNKETIDEFLYKEGIIKIREINSFLDLLKTVSITK